jgi:UDP-4-amino-4,6-dideoxy-N-acetyl-beta-L-altrosamine N-acetyltransferase
MTLRRLNEEDLELVLSWRNAPAVRRCMFSNNEISFEEHKAWFERVKDDPNSRWFIYEDETGAAVATANLVDIRARDRSAFWGFYAAPSARKGTGTRLCRDALDIAFGELRLHKVNAEVLATNKKSLYLHRKLGFLQEGAFRDGHFDGLSYVDVFRFGLLATEWDMQRVV